MNIDKNNKELGRALAAIASADGQLRSRGRITGLLFPSTKKAVLLGATYMALQNADNELLGPIGPTLEKLKEKVPVGEIVAMVGPTIEQLMGQVAERIDAIQG